MRRRLVLIGFVCLTLPSVAPTVGPPPDTPAAAYTRTRKLKVKVSVEFDKTPIRDAFKAISDQLERQKLGVLLYRLAPTAPAYPTVTYSGKQVTIEQALDGMLKPLGCGYVVVSKPGDRGDGWLELSAGNLRGYPPGVTPLAVETSTASAEDEKAAQTRLDLAKQLAADDKADRAKVLLRFVVKRYPGTKAAAEAKALLEKLDP